MKSIIGRNLVRASSRAINPNVKNTIMLGGVRNLNVHEYVSFLELFEFGIWSFY